MNANSGSTVQVDFSLAIGSGRLDASLEVPTDEVTLTQLLPVLQTLSNNIIGDVVRIIGDEGYTVSCRAGCGACCRQLVPISLFEAEALSAWIASLPAEEQDALEARFHSALLALRDAGMLDRLTALTSANGQEAQLAVDYLALKVPCPFLVDESCGIHPIRPLICREYLVTSPPEFCAAPSASTVRGVPLPLKVSSVLFKLGAQVDRGTQGWIPLVFLFAWRNSGFRPGDSIAGPGPQLLYEIVKRLTPA